MVYKYAKANAASKKENRRELRKNLTAHEAVLWKMLKEKQVNGLKFRRQHSIGEYILDFYCPSIRLCIELDGNCHYTPHGLAYDEKRTRFLNDNGINVMRFENKIVMTSPEYIINCITEYAERYNK